jgi:hypothetical protein
MNEKEWNTWQNRFSSLSRMYQLSQISGSSVFPIFNEPVVRPHCRHLICPQILPKLLELWTTLLKLSP